MRHTIKLTAHELRGILVLWVHNQYADLAHGRAVRVGNVDKDGNVEIEIADRESDGADK